MEKRWCFLNHMHKLWCPYDVDDGGLALVIANLQRINLRIFKRGLGSDLGSKGGNKFWSESIWTLSASVVSWWIKDTVSWRCTPFSIPRKCCPRSCERLVQVQWRYCSRRLCCHLCSSIVLFNRSCMVWWNTGFSRSWWMRSMGPSMHFVLR